MASSPPTFYPNMDAPVDVDPSLVDDDGALAGAPAGEERPEGAAMDLGEGDAGEGASAGSLPPVAIGNSTVPLSAPELAELAELAELGEYREQDRFLPIANVSRIMKRCLPDNAKIAKEAKECVQECVSEFISFITSEAQERCMVEKRKTINGEDLVFAMTSLGFENYAETLRIYLAKFRAHQAATTTRKGSTSAQGGAEAGGAAAGGDDEVDDDDEIY